MGYALGALVLIAIVAALAFVAWSRAGGAARASTRGPEEARRRQFALASDEHVLRTFRGVLYFGRLRPDLTPESLDALPAATGSPARGHEITLALTDKGRLAISRGPVKDDGSPGPQLPFRMWGPPGPKPRVLDAVEAFSGSPYLDEASRGPSRGADPLLLVHFEAPDGPLTFWVEPGAPEALRAWVGEPTASRPSA